MNFGVLGPIEAKAGGKELPLGGPKQRALLALLLLNANEAVSRDRLIEGLWGDRPPGTAAHTLDTYVSRLKKLLGTDRLMRRAPGYVLRLADGELDLDRFEQLVRQGRELHAEGNADEAASVLRSALALWRGPALADVLYEPFASLEAERLEEQRLGALEDRIDADLACGRSSELVTELEQLVRGHPFRERLLGQLMLALYRSGQQARALDAYRSGRSRLAEELGLEPSPRLQELERGILQHDPALSAPESSPRIGPRKRSRRTLIALSLVSAAVIAGVATAIVLGASGTTASRASGSVDQVVELSAASGARVHSVPLADSPAATAFGDGSLWLANPGAGTVDRVNPSTLAVVDHIPVGGTPGAIAVGGGAVWVASALAGTIARIDPGTDTVTQTVPLGGARLSTLAFGDRKLWVGDLTDETLIEVDPASGAVRRTLTLPVHPTTLAIPDGKIWVADYDGGTVSEVESRTGNTLATVPVGTGPAAMAVGPGAVWVVNTLDSTVSRIDTTTDSVAATIPVGSGPDAITLARGSVWVAGQYSGTVSRIDPGRNAVVGVSHLNGSPTSLATARGHLWVGTQSVAAHRGGALKLLNSRPETIDPALQFDLLPLVADGLTRDGLVTYNHAPGPAGIQIVPDLAISVPRPTSGGTTYTFRLRSGIRYSDGEPVRAADFRRAIERLFRLDSPARIPFTGIVGADSCTKNRCDLSRGVLTDDAAHTVSFRLRAPDPDFIANLTSPAASAVPSGTPWHEVGTKPIPSTGPYEIASASSREIRWIRNPFFHEWSHAAQPDGNPDAIVLRIGLSAGQETREIEAGRADWSEDKVPGGLLPGLQTRFPGRLHSWEIPTTDFFQFNTTRSPFDDVRVRQALNFAIDRRTIVALYGGRELALPTCQVLPPGVPGYRRYCPYTSRPSSSGAWNSPDLRRAQRLVAASGTRGAQITVWGWTDDPTISPDVIRYTADVLARLGYHTHVHLVPHAYFSHGGHAKEFRTIQLMSIGWGDTPYGYFSTFFSCQGIFDHGWFCDRHIERQNVRAHSLVPTNPQAAASLWARVDRELVDRAVWLPMINERGIDFLSARVRNYQSHPYWGMVADQLWLR